MQHKNLNTIIEKLKDWLISLYLYNKHTMTIPVFVVKEVNFLLLDTLRPLFAQQHFILLTQEDIVQWKDVFCLKLLHIYHHAKLFYGVDILWQQQFQQSDIRSMLELEIRYTLIQLREDYLFLSRGHHILNNLLVWMIAVWEYALLLKNPAMELPTDTKQLLALFDVAWSCNSQHFYYLIDGVIKERDIPIFIQRVHEYLTDLCSKINAF